MNEKYVVTFYLGRQSCKHLSWYVINTRILLYGKFIKSVPACVIPRLCLLPGTLLPSLLHDPRTYNTQSLLRLFLHRDMVNFLPSTGCSVTVVWSCISYLPIGQALLVLRGQPGILAAMCIMYLGKNAVREGICCNIPELCSVPSTCGGGSSLGRLMVIVIFLPFSCTFPEKLKIRSKLICFQIIFMKWVIQCESYFLVGIFYKLNCLAC